MRNVPNVPAAIFATRFVSAVGRDWEVGVYGNRV